MKLGFVHVPKCAGTALSETILRQMQLKWMHISRIADEPTGKRWELVRNTMAYRLAQNSPYLSGHISFTEMKQLDRDFVFTVLRDPRERLFSLYTYNLRRAEGPRALANDPSLRRYYRRTFDSFVSEFEPNQISRKLLADLPDCPDIIELRADQPGSLWSVDQLRGLAIRSLQRFDSVFCGPDVQSAVDGLAELGWFPPTTVSTVNATEHQTRYEIGCSEQRFIELLEFHTWVDCIVFQEAATLYPERFPDPLPSTDAVVTKLQSRFQLEFDAS